jgi:hypothetical protein
VVSIRPWRGTSTNVAAGAGNSLVSALWNAESVWATDLPEWASWPVFRLSEMLSSECEPWSFDTVKPSASIDATSRGKNEGTAKVKNLHLEASKLIDSE